MTIDPLTGLPAVLAALISTGALSSTVSGVLSTLAPLIVLIPGFRPNDGTRSTLMRVLVFLLTFGGLVGAAALLSIPITPPMWLLLLAAAGGGTGYAHWIYTGYKNSQSSGLSAPVVLQTSQASIPAPVITLDRLPLPSPDAPAPSMPGASAS